MADKEKRRIHFNVVDAVILLLAAAVVVGALALRNRSTGTSVTRETVPMRFTVEMVKSPADLAKQMDVGDDVYRSTDGAYLGKVAEVRCVPHLENAYSEEAGRFIRYEYEENYDVYLTVEGDGYSTKKDIVVGGTASPKIGGEMPVKGKGFARMGYVVGIDPMGAALAENTDAGTGELEAVYTVCFDDLRTLLLDGVHVGDRLYERTTGALLGEVLDIETKPHGETHLDAGGQPVYAEKEDCWDVYVRVRGRAVEKADGYYLDGGTELKVGANVIVNSQYLERTGTFYALESIGAAK